MKHLVIIVPVFNEESNIEITTTTLLGIRKSLKSMGIAQTILFADNCSTDGSLAEMKLVSSKNKNVEFVGWIRNLGVTNSVLNALKQLEADSFLIIDCDGQDSPDHIVDFCKYWLEGYDFVYGIRVKRKESFLLSSFRSAFKGIVKIVGGNGSGKAESGFWLISDEVKRDLLENPPTTTYLAGTLSARGYKSRGVPYERHSRRAGQAKFGFIKYFSYALEGILGDNLRPLRFSFFLGLLGSVLSFVVLSYMFFAIAVLRAQIPLGLFSTALMINLYGFLILLAIGVVGEYVGRVFQKTAKLPSGVISQSSLLPKQRKHYRV